MDDSIDVLLAVCGAPSLLSPETTTPFLPPFFPVFDIAEAASNHDFC
jgi:hypothetical protein